MMETEFEQPGLYVQYPDGSVFELYPLRCSQCGAQIDSAERFYLRVTPAPAAPCIVTTHSRCVSEAIVLSTIDG
jgi:hypothetical protein